MTEPIFVKKYFNSWDPKTHVLCNYLQIFNVAALIDKYGTTNHYPLALFQKIIKKRQDHLLQARCTMEFLRHPLILQWHPRKIKIAVPRIKWKRKEIIYLKKKDDALFKISPKIPAFVLEPLKAMPKLVVWQKWSALIFLMIAIFKIGYCGHSAFPYAHIQLEQATKLIPAYF